MDSLYERVQQLKVSGDILNVWSDGMDTPHEGILSEVAEFLYGNESNSPQAEAFIQIYSWEYQSIHEGVTTYYSNLYEYTPYEKIIETAENLKKWGCETLYAVYIKGAGNYDRGLKDAEYPAEWLETHKEIDKWINNNLETIFHCMLSLLDTIEDLKNA